MKTGTAPDMAAPDMAAGSGSGPGSAQGETALPELACGVRVIEGEIAGLQALAVGLDENFSEAVNVIDHMRNKGHGRLIIAGIGKSGHVARKIVATAASTGTPAYYIHPGEASHGDLGIVTKDDVVLMLSNSGENAELSDLMAYTRRYGNVLIAVTSNAQSTLAQHADIVLCLPDVPEACPNGMAPTTSTTMMMALGDALAVALLERRGLTAEQFKVFHPGGKLGQRLMPVAKLMHSQDRLPIVADDEKMSQAILQLSEKNLGCVIVTDTDGALRGIITDGDLKRHMSADLLQKSVADIMSTQPRTILHTALVEEALQIMTKNPDAYVTSLVVVDESGNLVGLIRLQDCLQAGVS